MDHPIAKSTNCCMWLLLPVGITASNAFMGKVHNVPILYLLLPLGNAATREWVVWSIPFDVLSSKGSIKG